MCVTDVEEMEAPAVEPDGHPQVHPADRGRKGPGLAQGGTHGDGGLGGHGRVVVAGERQEQGVAAELEQRAALAVGDLEHPGEHVVEDLGQLLGADAAPPGQALGEGGEARDVHEAARGLHLAPQCAGCVEVPFGGHARDIGREHEPRCRVPHRNQPCTTGLADDLRQPQSERGQEPPPAHRRHDDLGAVAVEHGQLDRLERRRARGRSGRPRPPARSTTRGRRPGRPGRSRRPGRRSARSSGGRRARSGAPPGCGGG